MLKRRTFPTWIKQFVIRQKYQGFSILPKFKTHTALRMMQWMSLNHRAVDFNWIVQNFRMSFDSSFKILES
jgi:hypothetical protein